MHICFPAHLVDLRATVTGAAVSGPPLDGKSEAPPASTVCDHACLLHAESSVGCGALEASPGPCLHPVLHVAANSFDSYRVLGDVSR